MCVYIRVYINNSFYVPLLLHKLSCMVSSILFWYQVEYKMCDNHSQKNYFHVFMLLFYFHGMKVLFCNAY